MRNTPLVSIIILNWNGLDDTVNCLKSLRKVSYPRFEILVVDNGSYKDEAERISKLFGHFVKTFRLSENKGFTGGNNWALKKANGKYILLLNNDTEVTKNFLEPLVKVLEENRKVAVVQPKIHLLQKRNYFDYAGAAGGFIDKYGYTFTRGRIFEEMEKDVGQYNDITDIFWASGAAMLVRGSVIKKVGGFFDEVLFNYMEEIDFCWRVIRKGYKVVFVSQSLIYHKGAASSGKNLFKKRFWEHRNNLLILARNLPRRKFVKIIFGRAFFELATYLHYFVAGRYKYMGSLFLAHLNFLGQVFRTRLFRFRVNGKEREPTIYPGSIVLDHFIFRKKKFSQLNWSPKSKIAYLIYGTKENTGNRVVFLQANKLIDDGFDVTIYSLTGEKVGWFPLKASVHSFMKSFIDWPPDILIATFWPTSYFVLFLMKANKKKFYFSQDWEEDFYKNPLLKFAARLTYTLPIDKIVISNYLRKRVKLFDKSGFSIKKIRYATIDPLFFKKGGVSILKKGTKNIVNVLSVISWYNRHKGPDLLVRAVKKIKKIHPNYRFTLVSLEKRSYGDAFDKFISRPKKNRLAELYRKSDVFLATSRSEGFFIPALEAMASGCPVVMTNSKGSLDYAKNNRNAVIVDNLDDLWEKDILEKTLKNKGLEAKVIEANKISKKYSSEFVIRELKKIYTEALA